MRTIHNAVTGETITFRRVSEARLEADFLVTAGGAPPAAHVHPRQTETFAVREGRCRVMVDGVEREAGPGDVVTVPPGVPHFWAAISDARMTVTVEPSLGMDRFFEDLFAIANAGHVNRRGLPTPLRFAVLLDDHRDLVYLAAAPVWLQRCAFAVLAKVGRALADPPRGGCKTVRL